MKTFVLDTNVLLIDPQAVLKFAANRVVIPVTVLEELDAKKHQRDELGANARAAVRLLAGLKNVGAGNLHQGVQISNGAVIRVQLELKTDLSPGLGLTVRGNRILMAAYLLHEQGENVVFVSKDFAARVKAEAMGLEAEDYEYLKVSYEQLHKGVREVEVTKNEIDHFFKDGSVRSEAIAALELLPNEFCLLRSAEQSSALGRWNGREGRLQALVTAHPDVWGVKPLNIEQRCALDLLLRPEIQLVTLVGQAGTGKTLLALACGLRQCYDDATYSKILISRPIVPMGKDIGYLPGTKEEKLIHWMQPIYDNLEFVCGTTGGGLSK